MEHAITIGLHTRFTLITERLVRLEYSPDGSFEDRTSIRLSTSRPSMPFDKIIEQDDETVLRTPHFSIHYTDDGQTFSNRNLSVTNHLSQHEWRPEDIDRLNLGGVHLGMDCIQRGIVPEGVHDATIDYHENSTDYHLWNYIFGQENQVDPNAHYGDEIVTLEQLTAMKTKEEMNPYLQDLLKERSKYPPGILSGSGYFVYNDSHMPVWDDKGWPVKREGQNMDLYLFYYGKDFRSALKDYQTLFGQVPMIPRYSLGLWYSRYPTLNQEDISSLVERFDDYQLPLDVMVLDLEWHQRGWYGFDWDLNHFPTPGDFILEMKAKNIYMTLNVHPDGVPVEDSRFQDFLEKAGLTANSRQLKQEIYDQIDFSSRDTADAFMSVFHEPLMDMGVDFWWIDGHVPFTEANVGHQFFTNHVYFDYMKEKFPDRRPLVFSRSEGLGSHRYPFHFTGDTYSQMETLTSQVEYTIRAGHIGQSFITHDIGGHMYRYKRLDPELLCRWYQFGVLSPIFRLHSSGGSERLPWYYDDNTMDSFEKATRLRMELLPYLYTLVWESHAYGLPMVRSNPLMHPHWETGYHIWNAYYLGDRLYCTPITTSGDYRYITLPEGLWYSCFSNMVLDSDGETRKFMIHYTKDLPPYFIKAGSLMVRQEYDTRASHIPEKILVEFYMKPGSIHDTFTLYEDDGLSNDFEKGLFTKTTFTIKGDKDLELTIKHDKNKSKILPNSRHYDIRIYSTEVLDLTYSDSFHSTRTAKESMNNHLCYTFTDIPGKDNHIRFHRS